MRRIFVTGIGTGIGKTVAAAILAEALEADYWKPVQAGNLERTDTMRVRDLLTNRTSRCHPEAWRLSRAMSPHAAARIDGVEIRVGALAPPATPRPLIIEGAGGLLVPLNAKERVADLIRPFGAETVVVSRHYLGSINHTLLTLEALARRDLAVTGIIFVGAENPATESVILEGAGVRALGRIDEAARIDQEFVRRQAERFRGL
ncbi:MAG: dethiobiotin synthase [Planctomycetes bacterium]|nr:dethiobiotin synthase [Planctomycetota bacterium]